MRVRQGCSEDACASSLLPNVQRCSCYFEYAIDVMDDVIVAEANDSHAVFSEKSLYG
jgi:hypothetical protein